MDEQKIGTENESPQQAGSESTERDSAKEAPQVPSEPEPTEPGDGPVDNGWTGPGGVVGLRIGPYIDPHKARE